MAEENENKKAPEANKKETVEVDRAVLDQILEKQQLQEESIEQLKKENERLLSTADVGRLEKFDAEHRGELIRKANVATLNRQGKDLIVLGWKSIEDTVRFVNGVLQEKQTAEYWLEGYDMENPEKDENKNFKVQMDLREWSQQISRLAGEIIKETTTPNGTATKTLRFPDGKEIEFDVVFINP